MRLSRADRTRTTTLSLLLRVMLIVAVALLPAIGMEIYNQTELRSVQRAELRDEALRQAHTVADEVERILDSARHVLEALAATPAITAGDAPECGRVLHGMGAHFAFLRSLALIGPDDRLICTSLPNVAGGRHVASAPYVDLARVRGGFTVGGYLFGQSTRLPLLTTAMPLTTALDGSADGTPPPTAPAPGSAPSPQAVPAAVPGSVPVPVLVADIDLGWMERTLRPLALQGGSGIVLLDHAGRVVLGVPRGPAPGTPASRAELGWLQAGHPFAQAVPRRDAGTEFVGVAPLSDLAVEVRLNQTTAAASQERAARRGYIVSGLGLLAALLLAVLLTRGTIGGPVDRILRAIGLWRAGQTTARVDPRDRRSEFGRIGLALDELFDTVERTERGLRDAKSELEARVAERGARLVAEVREREAVQAQLLQAQKMEVVGRLTGGVAHDFNNLLTAVIGNLELATLRSRDRPELQRLLQGALRAAERGASLTQRMLAFGRRQFLQLRPVQVDQLLAEMHDLLARTIGPTVWVEVAIETDLWPARADPNQLELVLLNLAINARDAMPQGGPLRIEAVRETVTRDAETGHPAQLAAGDYVRLSLGDEGTGIPPDILPQVLEPFFTTKPAGRGSGLGLSMAHGVAVQSGGGLVVASTLGKGTTVTVWLPRDEQEQEASAPHASPALPLAARSGPGVSVLLVDDDADVAEVSAQLLMSEGYDVTRAENGPAALALFDGGLAPDLLIADLAMPGMSGLQLAALARARRPGLPVLLATGYIAETTPLGAGESENPGYPVLEKPFRAQALLSAVHDLLGAAGETGPVGSGRGAA